MEYKKVKKIDSTEPQSLTQTRLFSEVWLTQGNS